MNKNDLTQFNTGGTHEQNPLGGIPQGNNNSVEEGETKQNDFIYSDRIVLNKDIIGQYGLPKSLTNKTVADATKLIDKKFKDRNDKISTSTKDNMLSKIAEAQEAMKPQEIPQEQMFMGGELDSGVEIGLGLAGTAIGGPIGGMIGITVGKAVSPLISKLLNKDKEQELARQNAIKNSSTFTNDFAYGGKMYAKGGILDTLGPVPLADDFITPTNLVDIKKYQLSKGLIPDGIVGPKTKAQFELDKRNWTPEIPDTSMLKSTNQPFVEPTGVQAEMEAYYQKNYPQNNKQYPKVNLSKIGDTLGQAARYAPIGMNAYQLSQLKKPGYSRLNRLDARFKPEYVDERSLQNIVGNEYDNTVNAITQMGGSEGATRNAILGAGLNKTKALGEAYMNAAGQNRQTNITGQQFNLGIDQANLNQANQELDINDRNQAAYRNEKSKFLAEIGNGVGDVGKEEVYKKIAATTTGYDWLGRYIKANPKATTAEIQEAAAKEGVLPTETTKKALGGYLIKNKRK